MEKQNMQQLDDDYDYIEDIDNKRGAKAVE